MSKIQKWNPWQLILDKDKETCKDYGVVVLNRPMNYDSEYIIFKIWSNAKIRVTVDGGTDRWITYTKPRQIQKLPHPDLITGDMDSISRLAVSKFANLSKIIPTPDQNETDFTKALLEVQKLMDLKNILVLTETSGRLDQILSNVNTLYKAKKFMPQTNVYLVCPDSVSWLLDEGEHSIKIPAQLRKDKVWCGLIPIGGACRVTTTGLKWNLKNSLMEFGQLVSTSNTYSDDEEVTVQTDRTILWTMGVEKYESLL
ncbi:PREDICTED: thiamin pyrophosphokinase 1 [Nicrophorus vespilloides]|uniref:Thiamin pyrophosphokinase 1 n=1 Tax=Nicrophorus vespilloides TaxID=110193 RepID=A0ABM1MHT1_NICVS|nr:PREDICTED: thiamin pyrophosphokinase 1 [Nicrophorus vespilloides]